MKDKHLTSFPLGETMDTQKQKISKSWRFRGFDFVWTLIGRGGGITCGDPLGECQMNINQGFAALTFFVCANPSLKWGTWFGLAQQKALRNAGPLFYIICRGGGIRTPGSLRISGFQDRCNKPLYHSSGWAFSKFRDANVDFLLIPAKSNTTWGIIFCVISNERSGVI